LLPAPAALACDALMCPPEQRMFDPNCKIPASLLYPPSVELSRHTVADPAERAQWRTVADVIDRRMSGPVRGRAVRLSGDAARLLVAQYGGSAEWQRARSMHGRTMGTYLALSFLSPHWSTGRPSGLQQANAYARGRGRGARRQANAVPDDFWAG